MKSNLSLASFRVKNYKMKKRALEKEIGNRIDILDDVR